ncbi:hypothetical protein ACLKA7_014133 [Drosophila subpalustris]
MKIILSLCLLLLLVSLAQAYPDPLQVEPLLESELNHRPKRATCDLLSGFSVNHSACAVHCIARGRRGGYCNGQAVCVCR